MAARPRTVLALLALMGLWLAGAAVLASTARAAELEGDLVGAFEFGPCPAGSPTGALCLHDSVRGSLSPLGPITGEFDVVIDAAASGPDGCSPADKQGSLVVASGARVDVVASGRYCFATSAADYRFTITGGSGQFAEATGKGAWAVPAPREFNGTSGEGDEHLQGTIRYAKTRLYLIGIKAHRKRVCLTIDADQPLHAARVSLRRHGHVLARSRSLVVSDRRPICLRSVRVVRRGRRYAVTAVGRDPGEVRVTARKTFRRRGRHGRRPPTGRAG